MGVDAALTSDSNFDFSNAFEAAKALSRSEIADGGRGPCSTASTGRTIACMRGRGGGDGRGCSGGDCNGPGKEENGAKACGGEGGEEVGRARGEGVDATCSW